MGYCKIVNKGNGKVVAVHQLNQDGTAYAEDVEVRVQAGVDPRRVDWLAQQDGKIGTFNFSFTASDADPTNFKFPEA
jgi:hypothetical protein